MKLGLNTLEPYEGPGLAQLLVPMIVTGRSGLLPAQPGQRPDRKGVLANPGVERRAER